MSDNVELVEEAFDAHISRPIVAVAAPWLHKRGVTPNAVSFVGLLLGVGAGFCFAGHGLWPILGMGLLLSLLVVDCVDGAIARLMPPSDRPWKGRMIDGICDALTIVSVITGMTVHLASLNLSVYGYSLGGLEWVVLGGITFAAMCYCTQALDKVKHRLKPNSPDHRVKEFALQEKNLWERILFVFFASNAGLDNSYREGDEERYRLLIIQGPTTRLMLASVTALLTAFYPSAFLVYFVATWVSVLYVVATEHRVRRMVEING